MPDALLEKRVRALKRLGVKRVRIFQGWDHVEPEKGELDWKSLDLRVNTFEKHGFDMFITLNPNAPGWARGENRYPKVRDGKSYASLEDYGEFFFKVAERYRDRIKYYEVINEPDLMIADVQTYLEFAKAGHRGIKRGAPAAIVLATGVSGVDFDRGNVPFTTKFLELGGDKYCDLIPFHPYAYPRAFAQGSAESPEENKQAEKQGWIRELCQKYNRRMWIGELGWDLASEGRGSSDERFIYPSVQFPKEERDFANYLTRSMLIGKMEPKLEAYFWHAASFDETPYNWKGNCTGYSPFGRGDNVLASGAAYANVASLTEGFTFSRSLDLKDENLWAAMFKRDAKAILAVWAVRDAFLLPGSLLGGEVKILDILGNEKRPERGGIRIDGEPAYILGSADAINAVSANMEKSAPLGFYEGLSITDSFLTSDGNLFIILKNRNGKQVSLGMELDYPGGTEFLRLELPALKEQVVTVPMKKTLKKGEKLPLKVRLVRPDYTSQHDLVLPPPSDHSLVATKANTRITIDGSLGEWPKEEAIYLTRKEQVLPPDPGVWGGVDDLSAVGYVMYDNEYLYFACDVKDDLHLNNQPADGLWAQDSIQLGMGTVEKREYAEISLALTNQGIKSRKEHGVNSGGPVVGLRIAIERMKEQKGLVYEAAIPLNALEPVSIKPGKTIAFAFIINDDDGRGRKWIGIDNPAAIGATKDLNVYPLLLFRP